MTRSHTHRRNVSKIVRRQYERQHEARYLDQESPSPAQPVQLRFSGQDQGGNWWTHQSVIRPPRGPPSPIPSLGSVNMQIRDSKHQTHAVKYARNALSETSRLHRDESADICQAESVLTRSEYMSLTTILWRVRCTTIPNTKPPLTSMS